LEDVQKFKNPCLTISNEVLMPERREPSYLLLSTAPSAPPSDLQLHMANASALNVYWNDVPLIHQDGVILGYRLLLQREDGGSVVRNITLGPDVHGYIVSDLLIFQNYSVQILAFTMKGDGPLSEKVYRMTDESGELNGLELKRTLLV